MEEIRGRLIEKIQRTEYVESFRFKLNRKIDFRPGQFLQVLFAPLEPNNKALNKYLSFSSSPTRDYIEITKRISASNFSGRLQGLTKGSEVVFKLPIGDCVFHDDYKKIGFLIGGIGITPVISIVEYIMEKKLGTDVFLFYSNRTDMDIAFKPELDRWRARNDKLKVYYTVTECEPTDNSCLYGFIDEPLLRQKAKDLNERIIFIFGPPQMVNSMCTLSTSLNCRDENIRIEQFTGY